MRPITHEITKTTHKITKSKQNNITKTK
jgi:hypothetical protein